VSKITVFLTCDFSITHCGKGGKKFFEIFDLDPQTPCAFVRAGRRRTSPVIALSHNEVVWLAGKTSFTQPLNLLLTPSNSSSNVYNDGRIDLKDYAILAAAWLEELLWP
jgi:hypothetical protein